MEEKLTLKTCKRCNGSGKETKGKYLPALPFMPSVDFRYEGICDRCKGKKKVLVRKFPIVDINN